MQASQLQWASSPKLGAEKIETSSSCSKLGFVSFKRRGSFVVKAMAVNLSSGIGFWVLFLF